jgi:hypothetical protein
LKKVTKKACHRFWSPINKESRGQEGLTRRSKKVQKSEKKACQRFRNLITLPKPNQTNGETNDTKRTKNV